MEQKNERLEDITIESPCTASWEAMDGDEQRRFCSQCDLHVVNLASLGREEGEALLAEGEADRKLCVRLEFHADGSCVTADAPRAPKPGRLPRVAAAALALGVSLSAACHTSPEPEPDAGCAGTEELETEERRRLLGKVAFDQLPEEGAVSSPEPPPAILGTPGPPKPKPLMGTPGPPKPKPKPKPLMGTPGPPKR